MPGYRRPAAAPRPPTGDEGSPENPQPASGLRQSARRGFAGLGSAHGSSSYSSFEANLKVQCTVRQWSRLNPGQEWVTPI